MIYNGKMLIRMLLIAPVVAVGPAARWGGGVGRCRLDLPRPGGYLCSRAARDRHMGNKAGKAGGHGGGSAGGKAAAAPPPVPGAATHGGAAAAPPRAAAAPPLPPPAGGGGGGASGGGGGGAVGGETDGHGTGGIEGLEHAPPLPKARVEVRGAAGPVTGPAWVWAWTCVYACATVRAGCSHAFALRRCPCAFHPCERAGGGCVTRRGRYRARTSCC